MLPDVLADVVIDTVETAVAPIRERLAAAEARLALTQSMTDAVGVLRDRIVAVETKALSPLPVDPGLSDLRDRVVVMETNAAHQTTTDLALGEMTDAVGVLRDRVVAVEMRDVAGELQRQIKAVEEIAAKDATRIEGYTSFLQRDLAAVSERVVAVERRAPDDLGDDAADHFAALLRKELGALEPKPATQQRVIRDANGQIERVIAEPA